MSGNMLPIPFANPATYPGHSGVDYGQALGTPFRASGPGVVRTLGRNARGGFFVWVQYDNGPLVGYHHMDSHNGCPRVGTRVNLGDRLGYVGNTGNSTGPHLHSEVSGHATTAGYWKFFTPAHVVGESSWTATAPSLTAKEIDMYEQLIAINNKVYGIGFAVIKHLAPTQLIDVRNVTGIKTVELTDNRRGEAWSNLVDYYGIEPGVLDIHGLVRDPFTGAHAEGNLWSEDRATRAELRQLAKRIK